MNYSGTQRIDEKVWAFLDTFKDKHQKALEYYQQVNAELDRYLLELRR